MRLVATLTVAWLISSCSQLDQPIRVPFVATWQGQAIDCSSPGIALSDLRFYISNVQLIDREGVAHDIRYATEMEWQNDAVAYIDLENGDGACQNGTAETFDHILAVAPAADYEGLRFTVGVPFRINHANPLTAKPPLDDPDMHWHWRSGYKFLRAGVRSDTDGFWIHTGSAGCEGTVGDITGCKFPNRIEVELPGFVPDTHAVAVDLTALLAGTSITDEVRSDCSSGPPETACVAPFAALGIDFKTGEQTGSQSVFSLR